MSKSVNLRFDGGSVGQQQQSATPHTIRNLTVRDMIITESGVAYSKQVLCDLDTPISGEPGFSPVSPEHLAQYVNAGDYIQLDLQAVMDSPESSVYRAFFNAVAFVNTSAGESTSSFNAYVLETDSKKFLNPLEVVFTVASDQLTAIQYLVVYDTRTLENTMVHDLILQDSIIVVDGNPATKHILCDKQHKTGNMFTPVSPAKLATWVSRGDYIALGTEAANDNSTASPLPMTNAVLSDNKCSQITFGGLSDGDTTKFGTGVTIEDEATGIEYIHIDSINVNSAVHDVQYIVIESIDNPPPGLYLSIQTAITNGKIPVIRYDGALYYFDKEYLEDDSPAYSFAGRFDSDEWKTAIRVTSEGVTLGNVLGVNGTVAEGVHNSFPLGGKCGIANDDEDYPYLIFEPYAYAHTAKFNGYNCKAYVSNAGETVSVQYGGETTEVPTSDPCLMFVIYKTFVSESHNDSGIQLPPGFLIIEDSSNRTIFAERAPVDRIVEAQNYCVILIRNTFSLTLGMMYTDSYSVHGGFWKKESSTRGCQNALAVGPGSIACGSAMSAAFNTGKAAGAVSLAAGHDALAGGAYTASFGENSIASASRSIAFGAESAALHLYAMVLAKNGTSGMECQTVLGRYNKLDPDSPFVIGWGDDDNRKNIMRLDQDGNVFTGKRLDLANNIMPLFKLPDSDPASPGTEPVTGYWICDSKKQLVTAAEIKTLHAMGMKFVLCENVSPDSNSRMYVEQKSVITNSTIDIEFVSADDVNIRKIVVQKETTADVTEASLYIASNTTTYLASMDQVKDMEETFLVNLPCAANTLRFEFSKMDYDPTVAGVGSSGTWKKVNAKFHNVWDWTKSGTSFANAFIASFVSIDNLVSVIAAGDTSAVTNMESMFEGCASLTSVSLFDTSAVTNMKYTFQACLSLTNVPLFDTSAVTDMRETFYECSKVEGGALALYQQASTQSTPPASHIDTFKNCGKDTVTGAVELAQIPASWGGTAP